MTIREVLSNIAIGATIGALGVIGVAALVIELAHLARLLCQ